jgi:hypothetical protein
MIYGGKHHDAKFWIENASVDWRENEAAFHTVARLSLLPDSQLSAACHRQCDARQLSNRACNKANRPSRRRVNTRPKSLLDHRSLKQMRAAFINKIAPPIANKMFDCGMVP